MAGKTTPKSPTMLAQSGEARNLTHCQASVGCLVPLQIASDRPLIGDTTFPSGPAGSIPIADLKVTPWVRSLMVQEPSVVMAACPALKIARLSLPDIALALGAKP